MLTKKYMVSQKNIPAIFEKIVKGTAPEKFTTSHLKGLGFTSSNDRGVIGVLKDLGFLSSDGSPTDRYHAYRDQSRSRAVMGEALREAYADLFLLDETLSEKDKDAVIGKFKSVHNATDRTAQEQARTFFSLLALADLAAVDNPPSGDSTPSSENPPGTDPQDPPPPPPTPVGLGQPFSGFRYNIEVHLPPSKDPEVYNAIFKAMKEHLLDQ